MKPGEQLLLIVYLILEFIIEHKVYKLQSIQRFRASGML